MKHLSRITLALVMSSPVIAEDRYVYKPESHAIYVEAKDYYDVVMSVQVHPDNDCEPKLYYFEDDDPRKYEEYAIDFKVKVDRREHWNVEEATYIREPGTGSIVKSATTERLITEFRRGNTVLFQFTLDDGSKDYTAFTLLGFSKAFGKAKAGCYRAREEMFL